MLKKKSFSLIPAALLLFALTLVLFALVPVLMKEPGMCGEEKVLLELVESSGAGLNTVNVTGWVRVDGGITGSGDVEKITKDAAELLNLPGDGRKVERWRNSYACGVKVESKTKDGAVFSVLGQALELPEGQKATHLMLSASGAGERQTGKYKKKICDVLRKYGNKGHVAVTCSGKIEKDLNGAELLAEAEKMMELAGAVVQERTTGDNLVSLTGLSPRFSNNMNYAGKEVNLNVALRSNPEERVTYVYAASPVIFTEY